MSPNPALSPEQFDILTEVINIGFGRAASSLSIMAGQKITLELPKISILTLAELSNAVSHQYDSITAVQQSFFGSLVGDVIFIMDMESSVRFVDLLCGGERPPRGLSASDREALLEVGNIMLGAYIGSFANLMHTPINYSMPILRTKSLTPIFAAMQSNGDNHSVLLVETRFFLDYGLIIGQVALIIDANSLQALFRSIQSTDSNETPL